MKSDKEIPEWLAWAVIGVCGVGLAFSCIQRSAAGIAAAAVYAQPFEVGTGCSKTISAVLRIRDLPDIPNQDVQLNGVLRGVPCKKPESTAQSEVIEVVPEESDD